MTCCVTLLDSNGTVGSLSPPYTAPGGETGEFGACGKYRAKPKNN